MFAIRADDMSLLLFRCMYYPETCAHFELLVIYFIHGSNIEYLHKIAIRFSTRHNQ